MLAFALLITALVLFILAAIGIAAGRINLIGAGLACLTLAELIGRKVLLLLLVGVFFFVTGCATNTGDPVKDRNGRVTNAVLGDVFNTVLSTGLAYGQSALAGQNGQDAAKAAFIAAGEANGVNALGDILEAYAGPEIQPLATAALQAISSANPQTPSDRIKVLNTVGAAIQTAANTYFDK